MTSTMVGQLTSGQKCLLDLLQRKLLSTIQSYAKLSLESQESGAFNEDTENELKKLKDKIRRISARQKRFTLEIINGNGNNTIPKESFFEALGLVTKEALSKLNSKSNERRRRTTANPRFSHEAIQAKRALEPLHKRLDQRARDNKRETSRRPQRNNNQHQSANNNSADNGVQNSNSLAKKINQSSNNNNRSSCEKNVINSSSSGSSNNSTNTNSAPTNVNNNVTASNNQNTATRSGPRTSNNIASIIKAAINTNNGAQNNRTKTSNHILLQKERNELLSQYGNLQLHINRRVSQIMDKRASNRHLEKQIELVRKRSLDLMSAINIIDPSITFLDDGQLIESDIAGDESGGGRLDEQPRSNTETLDIYIDMKCDESLDGLD